MQRVWVLASKRSCFDKQIYRTTAFGCYVSGRQRASPTMLSEAMSETEKKSRSARNRRWSAEVTKRSDALDLEHNVFKSRDPRKIARSLKHSAEQSNRRKGTPYQAAMSMLNNDAFHREFESATT